MAVFTNIDIKKRRELLKMTAATLAEIIGCDTHTVYNWESSKSDPDPDTVYLIADAFGDFNIWDSWMRTKFWSYSRTHADVPQNNIQGATMRMFAEVSDVLSHQMEVMRDLADGKFDDKQLREVVIKECSEASGAIQTFLNTLKSCEGKCNG